MKRALSILTFFGSSATLVCCALPALLVGLGAGAALAGVVGAFPQLTWLSEYKEIVFGIALALLIATGLVRKVSSEQPCPIDQEMRKACQTSKDWSGKIYALSWIVLSVGVFFAFVAPKLFAGR